MDGEDRYRMFSPSSRPAYATSVGRQEMRDKAKTKRIGGAIGREEEDEFGGAEFEATMESII